MRTGCVDIVLTLSMVTGCERPGLLMWIWYLYVCS